MFDFVTIDFETATSERHSPCEIGLTVVENGKLGKTISYLIKPPSYPYFNPWNIKIHGIRPQHVADAPDFLTVWDEIQPYLKGRFLFAHNAAFDFSVIRKTFEYYHEPCPELNYACSCKLSQAVLPDLPSHRLDSLCAYFGINFQHHRAGDDSQATAELLLKIFEIQGVKLISDMECLCRKRSTKEFKPTGKYRCDDIVLPPKTTLADDFIPDFTEKKVCCTGEFSMTKEEIQQKIMLKGGVICNSVTRKTEFLVVGYQNKRIVGETGKSSKQRKAEELIEKGHSITILSEDDFLKYAK